MNIIYGIALISLFTLVNFTESQSAETAKGTLQKNISKKGKSYSAFEWRMIGKELIYTRRTSLTKEPSSPTLQDILKKVELKQTKTPRINWTVVDGKLVKSIEPKVEAKRKKTALDLPTAACKHVRKIRFDRSKPRSNFTSSTPPQSIRYERSTDSIQLCP